MQGRLLDRRYEIISSLGRGFFGATYLAKDNRRMGRQCVVKHLQPGSNDPYTLQEAERLFHSEAETLEKLGHHDQIPDLIDYFQENNEFYLVQELVEGYPLTREILPLSQLAEHQVIEILKDVLEVLSFVHKCQVIHRDIKPSNLMRRHKDQKIILIDFGAVKQIKTQVANAQGQTSFTRVIGTEGYMPVEQLKGKPEFNSDIYALGITAIEALTGVPPKQLQENPRTGEVIWEHLTQVSTGLKAILDKMVLPHWMARYQSADDVLNDLRKLPPPKSADWLPKSNKNKSLIGEAILILAFVCGWWGIGHLAIPSQAENLFKQGVTKLEKKDWKGAIEDYTQAIRLNSNYAEAYNGRGDALYNQQNYQEAISDYTQAIRLNPNYDKAYHNRGNARYYSGDKLAAISDYTQAIRLNPNYDAAYNDRGFARSDMGDKLAAIEDYNQLIRLNPNDALAYYNRGVARSDMGDKLAAIEDYTRAIQAKGEWGSTSPADAYYNRGIAHSDLGNKLAAISDYTQAIRINPNYIEAYNNRGLARYDLGNKLAAIEDYNQAIRINPNNDKAYYNRGLARFDLGDKLAAIKDYNQAIRLNPKYSHAYYNRGNAHSDLGNKPAASADFQKAAQLYQQQGKNSYYQDALKRIKQLQ